MSTAAFRRLELGDAMVNRWYYRQSGQEFGPLELADLSELARTAALAPDASVRRGERGPWMSAQAVPELFAQAAEHEELHDLSELNLEFVDSRIGHASAASTAGSPPHPAAAASDDAALQNLSELDFVLVDSRTSGELPAAGKPPAPHVPARAEPGGTSDEELPVLGRLAEDDTAEVGDEPIDDEPPTGSDPFADHPHSNSKVSRPQRGLTPSDEPADDEPLDEDDFDEEDAVPVADEPQHERIFVLIDEVEHGPFNREELQKMAAAGRVRGDHRLRSGDDGQWQFLRDVADGYGLGTSVQEANPPVPPLSKGGVGGVATTSAAGRAATPATSETRPAAQAAVSRMAQIVAEASAHAGPAKREKRKKRPRTDGAGRFFRVSLEGANLKLLLIPAAALVFLAFRFLDFGPSDQSYYDRIMPLYQKFQA
ncbi:MAG: DUF4339 domain-containing protein, partial [Planctomycetes bacterium]|nr:DUF4339 domain-containing protein [Planctomycetota bacterium]